MKLAKIVAVSAAMAALLSAGTASAQFKMPGGLGGVMGGAGNVLGGALGGGGNRGPSNSGGAGSMMSHFIQARTEVNAGQLLMAKAFEMKDQIALLEAEKTTLSSGTLDSDGYKKSKELSESVTAEIDKRMDSGAQLSAEGRRQWEEAGPHLLSGLGYMALMVQDGAGAARSPAASMGGMLSGGLTAVSLIKDGPGFARSSKDAYGKYLTYSRANKIPVPKDSTNALGNL